jgi:diguanylate cyclase (GGDEF)-like protein
VNRNARLLLIASIATSLVVLWYVDWILPNVHLGPVAALPLFLLGYRIGLWPTLPLAAAAAIALAVADADSLAATARLRFNDIVVDSAMLLVAFGIAAFAADRARRRDTEVAALRNRVARERSRAETDSVTQLPNRVSFERQLDHAAKVKDYHALMGIIIADVDNFKEINDRRGHRAGDMVLQEVARRLDAAVRKTDTVARIGGDEFGLILRGVESVDDVNQVCEKVRLAFATPFVLGGEHIGIGLSIGHSIFPDEGDDLRTLVDIADRRMYQAKLAVRAAGVAQHSFG